jgi:ketosteroid isomerase-like protein
MNEPKFRTPEEAEAAFYRAFEATDLQAMAAVWLEDEVISCVHPVGGNLLRGHEQVLESWRNILSRQNFMRFTLVDVAREVAGDLAVHTGIERISLGEDPTVRAEVVFTNAFRRTDQGWRMILHHATPLSPPRPREDEDEDEEEERVLH